MQSAIERGESGIHVTLVGSGHLGGLPSLEQALRSVVADLDVGVDVTIDIDGLTSIHDAAIGMLGGTIVDITGKGGTVHVICQHRTTLDRIRAIGEALA